MLSCRYFFSKQITNNNINYIHIILETLFATAKIGEDLRLEQILSRVLLRYYYCGKTLASMASKA